MFQKNVGNSWTLESSNHAFLKKSFTQSDLWQISLPIIIIISLTHIFSCDPGSKKARLINHIGGVIKSVKYAEVMSRRRVKYFVWP